MKSYFVTQLGEPKDALVVKESAQPNLQNDQILIRVEAFALNFFDILQCQGKYQEKPELPFTPGAEVAGVIEEVGSAISSYDVGQRVLATPLLPNGGYSEYVAIHESNVFPIPDELSYSKAASMFITYHTAYYALKERAQLRRGESVLVHAGSGGVGSAAIQLAKTMGATVFATAGSEEKLGVCKELGADHVINYREESFEKVVKELTGHKGADVIFDPVGGDVFHRSRKCINFSGRILLIGFAGGDMQDAPMNHALIKNYSLVGVHFGYFRQLFPEKVKEAHEELMVLYQQGSINPLIYQTYSFNQVVEGLEDLASRRTYGKVVVQPIIEGSD
ncbi:NADPH:quinone oxidoreductase family protein [Alkalibacillus aidingensis]|uniref:NADPH:quinone oxidoreductase family protein n=1 Tax=Alkalibacillus aidingensis TaxID=2747607 RepID=UPI0016612F87|nr:NADPH:quinone oxidoreductase family protein [Alkalibacillus aidingensis]